MELTTKPWRAVAMTMTVRVSSVALAVTMAAVGTMLMLLHYYLDNKIYLWSLTQTNSNS